MIKIKKTQIKEYLKGGVEGGLRSLTLDRVSRGLEGARVRVCVRRSVRPRPSVRPPVQSMWAILAKNESGFESKNSRDLSGGGAGGKGSESTNQPKSDLSYRNLQNLEL